MANGDAAAAAGMDVVPGTADLRQSYDEENKGRDYLAAHITKGTHTQSQILGLPAKLASIDSALAGKQSALDFTPVRQGGGSGMGSSVVRIGWDDAGSLLAQVDSTPIGKFLMQGGGGSLGDITVGHLYTPVGRATPVTSSYVAAYLNGDGRLGASASSRRFKKEIAAWSPDQQAVLAMQLVTFRYKAAVHGSADAPVEVGLIAEDLHELGLEWLVFYDDDEKPQGIHYDRIALALLPVVQDHESRLAALEARLEGSAE